LPGVHFFQKGYGMYVIIIHESDGSHNVIGPFWHRVAADDFLRTLTSDSAEIKAEIASVTDREKFSRTAAS
jgi:hypothetical protein